MICLPLDTLSHYQEQMLTLGDSLPFNFTRIIIYQRLYLNILI